MGGLTGFDPFMEAVIYEEFIKQKIEEDKFWADVKEADCALESYGGDGRF